MSLTMWEWCWGPYSQCHLRTNKVYMRVLQECRNWSWLLEMKMEHSPCRIHSSMWTLFGVIGLLTALLCSSIQSLCSFFPELHTYNEIWHMICGNLTLLYNKIAPMFSMTGFKFQRPNEVSPPKYGCWRVLNWMFNAGKDLETEVIKFGFILLHVLFWRLWLVNIHSSEVDGYINFI